MRFSGGVHDTNDSGRIVMIYSLLASAVAFVAVIGAWGLTKEALRTADPDADSHSPP